MNEKRMLVALIFSAVFALMLALRTGEQEGKRPRYLPYVFSGYLPISVGTILVLDGLAWETAAGIFVVFLHISLYFLLLTLVLPLLRRYIQALACAALWIIPNYLYMATLSDLSVRPRWVIPLPRDILKLAMALWLVGVVGVLGWKIISHLRFRRYLLHGAEEITDPAVLAVWQAELARAGEKLKLSLVASPRAATPMTIGLFSGSIQVVLPARHYTPEELSLIFRHELVHIGRQDSWNKFFLVFCTAMCWFNPLMWLAMNKSSEDLELSCDEAVLGGLEKGERRRYADLILRTAGDGRGFTTCLSASASALRYRLKNIVKPTKKLPGSLLVGVVFFALFMTCGYVTFAYSVGRGESLIYQDLTSLPLRSVSLKNGGEYTVTECRDEEGLRNYLSSLTLCKMAGETYFDEEGQLVLVYDAPDGVLTVVLWGDYVKVVPFWEENLPAYYYYVSEGLDWERLGQFFDVYPLPGYEAPDPLPPQQAGFPEDMSLPEID